MTKGKILFVARFPIEFAYFKSILESFLRKGYHVKVLFGRKKGEKNIYLKALKDFKNSSENFKYDFSVKRKDFWSRVLRVSREALSYRRYLMIPGDSSYYRERLLAYLPAWFSWTVKNLPPLRSFLKSSLFEKMCRFLERIAPLSSPIIKDLKGYNPDAVLCSPVNMRVMPQVSDLEYLKTAKALGIPAVLPVHSWDNLTNKGLIHVVPDLLLVWSETQKKEAMEIHKIPEENIKITGSPLFDPWFSGARPSVSRREFCERFGLKAEDPFIVYLGSSIYLTAGISKDESYLVEKLKEALRNSGQDAINKIQLVVRPHPSHWEIYKRLSGVCLIPPEGRMPSEKEDFELFFDTLYYAAAAIGVNTSAMLDAIAASKPVIAFIAPEYSETQAKTQHFQHLYQSQAVYSFKEPGGLPKIMEKILKGEDSLKGKREEFVKSFIRPRGFEKSAGDLAVEEVEKLITLKNKEISYA